MLSIRVPFANREQLTLKKVGQELIVRAGREKRTIILPSALARQHPSGARLEDGNLEISFEDGRPAPAPAATSGRKSRTGRATRNARKARV